MAHSQIVVVIAFSITFGIDATIVRHRRPLGNLGSAVVFQSPCTMICRGMLPFAFVCLFVLIWPRILVAWHPRLVVS